MKRIFKKLKLIDSFITNLPLSKQDFVERLSAITEDGNTGFSFGRLEHFSSAEYEYVGKVNFDGFKIRRRLRFLGYRDDSNIIAKGRIIENNEYLIVETEINSLGSCNIFFLALSILLFAFIFITIKMSADPVAFNGTIFFVGLWVSILYLNMRASVKKFNTTLKENCFI